MKKVIMVMAPLFAVACATQPVAQPGATAALKATAGNQVGGNVSFSQVGDKLIVVAEASGLTPGLHGFHIHDKGDCSAPDATSAGGHFNPHGKAHGHPGQTDHHAGDMPQLEAGADGKASLKAELLGVRLQEIIGRSVIVHAAPDDFKTQPTGNSGARVACGLITTR